MSGADEVGGGVLRDSAAVAERPAYESPTVIGDANAPRRLRFAMAREALRFWRTRIGLAVTLAVVCIALFGPLAAPHSPTQFLAPPYAHPSAALPLGADYLGRDVVSRVLHGGLSILLISAVAAVLGLALGTMLGLTAGYVGGVWDEVIMRSTDVLLAFPAIVLALLLMSMVGPKTWLTVVAIVFVQAPQTARVMRGAAIQLTGRDFITYAETLGLRKTRILLREILPNVTAPLSVGLGLGVTYAVGIVASLGFLGFGAQPPAADWGLMIYENRGGVTIQPWPVVVPVILIALLTIGNSLITDGFGRAAAGIDRTLDVSGE
jgi:peptide/nickel transport system permease protein